MNKVIGYAVRTMIASIIREYIHSLPIENADDRKYKETALGLFNKFQEWLYFEMNK